MKGTSILSENPSLIDYCMLKKNENKILKKKMTERRGKE